MNAEATGREIFCYEKDFKEIIKKHDVSPFCSVSISVCDACGNTGACLGSVGTAAALKEGLNSAPSEFEDDPVAPKREYLSMNFDKLLQSIPCMLDSKDLLITKNQENSANLPGNFVLAVEVDSAVPSVLVLEPGQLIFSEVTVIFWEFPLLQSWFQSEVFHEQPELDVEQVRPFSKN